MCLEATDVNLFLYLKNVNIRKQRTWTAFWRTIKTVQGNAELNLAAVLTTEEAADVASCRAGAWPPHTSCDVTPSDWGFSGWQRIDREVVILLVNIFLVVWIYALKLCRVVTTGYIFTSNRFLKKWKKSCKDPFKLLATDERIVKLCTNCIKVLQAP